MSVKLKPCPFCGCKNVQIYSYDETTDEEAFLYCHCPDCGSSTAICNDEKIAAEKWNRRAKHER